MTTNPPIQNTHPYLTTASSLMIALSLTACAPVHKITTESPMIGGASAPAPQAARSAASITHWEMSGGIAAKSPKQGWTATYHWAQQGPTQYELHLYGALGGKTIAIKQSGNHVTYQDGQKNISSNQPEKLFFEQTGIRLPINHLYYWTRGLPAPHAPSTEKTLNNQVSVLSQSGYTITYLNHTIKNGVSLPTKLELRGKGIMIKLIIKQWTF